MISSDWFARIVLVLVATSSVGCGHHAGHESDSRLQSGQQEEGAESEDAGPESPAEICPDLEAEGGYYVSRDPRVCMLAMYICQHGFAAMDSSCGCGCKGPPTTTCAPQDAAGEGPCRMGLGTKWDGDRCVNLGGCQCIGADCDELYPSEENCIKANAKCCGGSCGGEQADLRELIEHNKACRSAADCQVLIAGCGVTEDDCTGAVYVNRSVDTERFESRVRALAACTHGGEGCASCFRALRDPVCVDGACAARR